MLQNTQQPDEEIGKFLPHTVERTFYIKDDYSAGFNMHANTKADIENNLTILLRALAAHLLIDTDKKVKNPPQAAIGNFKQN